MRYRNFRCGVYNHQFIFSPSSFRCSDKTHVGTLKLLNWCDFNIVEEFGTKRACFRICQIRVSPLQWGFYANPLNTVIVSGIAFSMNFNLIESLQNREFKMICPCPRAPSNCTRYSNLRLDTSQVSSINAVPHHFTHPLSGAEAQPTWCHFTFSRESRNCFYSKL